MMAKVGASENDDEMCCLAAYVTSKVEGSNNDHQIYCLMETSSTRQLLQWSFVPAQSHQCNNRLMIMKCSVLH